MLSSILGRPSKGLRRNDRSPFSSPYTDQSSHVGVRRDRATERRRVAADFDGTDDEENIHHQHGDSFGEEEEDEDDNDDEGEDDDDEEGDNDNGDPDADDDGGLTPLLPIFEASHLGELRRGFT